MLPNVQVYPTLLWFYSDPILGIKVSKGRLTLSGENSKSSSEISGENPLYRYRVVVMFLHVRNMKI